MARFLPLALATLIAAAPAHAQEDAGAFTVGSVSVDVAGKSAIAAREGGWREAQRRAWPQLWSRLTGAPAVNAPKLGDSALDAIVQAIEVEKEAVGATRYVATLGIVFDRARAGKYLGASARMLRSSPMLLMPVLVDGGTRTAYEKRTPWLAAWARFGRESTPLDYVRAPGTAGDAVILTGAQAYRSDRGRWRAVLARYAAADVLVAEAVLTRRWPGGPVDARFRALHGPDGEELARFTLSAPSADALPATLDAAVRRIDSAYTEALRAGRLHAEEDLTVDLAPVIRGGPTLDVADIGGPSIEVEVETPDAGAAAQIEDKVRTAAGVLDARLTSVAFGGVSRLRIGYLGDRAALAYALDQAGLRLEGKRLRARRADEAPLPPPAPPVDAAAPPGGTVTTEGVDEADGAALDRPAAAGPPPPRPQRTAPQAIPPRP